MKGLTTLSKRFIWPIPAVPLIVTHFFHAYTLPAAAFKSGRTITVANYGRDRIKHQHKLKILQIIQKAGKIGQGICTIYTAQFITHVFAVIVTVALAAAMDACAITAFKLIWTAGDSS